MVGDKRQEEGGGSSRAGSSSLESQLQQAWLQSQIPKVQRRSVSASLSDVAREKRAGDAVLGGDKIYFHKTRPDSLPADFLRRFATPQLETISNKTDLPVARSNSAPLFNTSTKVSPSTSSGDGSFSQSNSRSFSSSADECSNDVGSGVFDSVDSDAATSGSVVADLAGETVPLALFLDDILTNEVLEEEKCMVQQTSAYQAMEKEIAGLLAPADSPASESDAYDTFWTNVAFTPPEETSAYKAIHDEFADLLSPESVVINAGESEVDNLVRSEEDMTLLMMEGYASMLSKHISSCSNVDKDVDYRTWITQESDEIECPEICKPFLESPSPEPLNSTFFDFNRLLHGSGRSNLSPESALSDTSLTELLYRCALAVSQRNTALATDYLAVLQTQTSPYGSSMQRMARYFMEALVAKLSGTGEELYTVITSNHPSAATMLKAFRTYVDYSPYIKLLHFFHVKSLLDSLEGAPRIHVIQYGIQYGVQWPSFLHHLSLRPEGPPHVRLTTVDHPWPGFDPCEKVNETGKRVAKFAERHGVPFEFRGFTGKWESFKARDFDLRDDEVLAVISVNMHKISDECVLSGSPRELLLKRIRSLNPKVFVFEDSSAAFNGPLFMTRFRESVKYYKTVFDGFELSMPPDDSNRVILERELFGREILNVVACEGQARVERAETYRQWQNRLQRAGFTLRPINPIILEKAKAMMATFHKSYGIGKDEGWFLIGINNSIVRSISVWEPTPLLSFIT